MGKCWYTVWLLFSLALVSLHLCSVLVGARIDRTTSNGSDKRSTLKFPLSEQGGQSGDDGAGTRWAVLVAGSNHYYNYRHQADVCHAYQLLRKGGLKKEHIVVFMYDDIADNEDNPRKGIIINNPKGKDVYKGVPKDYTGDHVNTNNLFAVLLGNKTALDGGSGKVLQSKPNDRIFLYYTDHGGPGVLGMPGDAASLYANDFVKVLKKMHKLKRYKEMVIYVEACESGSIFQGLLPDGINIYVTTAANAEESSYGTYCPGWIPPPPKEYTTCLGDLYSVAWMEDSETHDLKKETLKEQYLKVKNRTSNGSTYDEGSHVMQYGNKSMMAEKLYLYQGFNRENVNVSENGLEYQAFPMEAVNQRDADLLHFWHKYERAKERTPQKAAAYKEMTEVIVHRHHIDKSVDVIGRLLFGKENALKLLNTIRSSDQALVDDWECLKSMVAVYEKECGNLGHYGLKHMRAFANVCNEGVPIDVMKEACVEACSVRPIL